MKWTVLSQALHLSWVPLKDMVTIQTMPKFSRNLPRHNHKSKYHRSSCDVVSVLPSLVCHERKVKGGGESRRNLWRVKPFKEWELDPYLVKEDGSKGRREDRRHVSSTPQTHSNRWESDAICSLSLLIWGHLLIWLYHNSWFHLCLFMHLFHTIFIILHAYYLWWVIKLITSSKFLSWQCFSVFMINH